MGRDWYRGGSGSGRGGVGGSSGGSSGKSSKSKRDSKTTSSSGGGSVMSGSNAVSGCMSAVFHLFDFHHFQFPLSSHHHHHHHHHQPSLNAKDNGTILPPQDLSLPKGVEAPRNSLESTGEEASFSPTSNKEESLNISLGIQIKTRTKPEALSNSNESHTPTTKTPTLVARLMGLDLLPDHSRPSSPSSLSNVETPNPRTKSRSRHKRCSLHRNSVDGGITGSRSLPETPRISLGRRSDVDHYHRPSLQLNKENACEHESMVARISSLRKKEMTLRQEDHENGRSPREYARQIVKQVKESVSRRVGTDITNTVKTKDELLLFTRDQESLKKASKINDSSTTPSCSPRLKFLEISKPRPPPPPPPPPQPLTDVPRAENLTVSAKPPRLQHAEEEPRIETQSIKPKTIKKCKKVENEMRFGSRMVKQPPQTLQEEPFVRSSSATNNANHGDKKCKRITPLSNDILNFSSVPSHLLPLKKDPSPPVTKLPQKQSNLHMDALKKKTDGRAQLSSCWSPTVEQAKPMHRHGVRDNNNISTTTMPAATASITTITKSTVEYEYITRILRRTGIDKDTPVSYAKWFSPAHPLDPSSFYFVEHFFALTAGKTRSSGSWKELSLRCNRKLLFDLVDEILVYVLKPHMNMRPWSSTCGTVEQRFNHFYRGSELIDELCMKIGQYPCADCRFLEDIDALVDGDLPEIEKVQREIAFEEEGEGIVTDIEREILDTLLHETASFAKG